MFSSPFSSYNQIGEISMKINLIISEIPVTDLMTLPLEEIEGHLNYFLNNPTDENLDDIKNVLEGYQMMHKDEHKDGTPVSHRQYALVQDIRKIEPGLQGYTLRLQKRTDKRTKESWYTISVRDVLDGGNNRRFYRSINKFWRTSLEQTIYKLRLARDEGWFLPTYRDTRVSVNIFDRIINSEGLSKSEKQQYLGEMITKEESEEGPFSDAKKVEFIIDIQAGSAETPTIWRKACLYNKDEDYLTFRSLTTDITYRPSIMLDPEVKVDRNNKTPIWKIDNSMMDASAETMEMFLAGLEYLESL